MRITLAFNSAVALLAAVLCRQASAANVNEFLDVTWRSGSTVLLPGRLYVPPESQIDPTHPRPLIVFLHGGSGRGENNLNQLNQDIDLVLAEAKRRGAFLLAPQAPLNWRPRLVTDRAVVMLSQVLTNYNGDANRVYLTGYSSGGGGTWNMLSRYPNRFAAAVPVAPVSAEPDFVPANLVGQPIMAFHARNDGVAPVQTTRNIITSILSAAHEPLPAYPALQSEADFAFVNPELDFNYFEPAAGDHSVLFSVYNKPFLYDWMFAHSLVPEPSGVALWLAAIVILPKIGRRTRLIRDCNRAASDATIRGAKDPGCELTLRLTWA